MPRDEHWVKGDPKLEDLPLMASAQITALFRAIVVHNYTPDEVMALHRLATS
jgi:hypothetical protein